MVVSSRFGVQSNVEKNWVCVFFCWLTKIHESAHSEYPQESNKLHIWTEIEWVRESSSISTRTLSTWLCYCQVVLAEGIRKCWTNFWTVFYIILIRFCSSPSLHSSLFFSAFVYVQLLVAYSQHHWSKSDCSLYYRVCSFFLCVCSSDAQVYISVWQ